MSLRRRALAVAWAVLQLALPAVGALAEAGLAQSMASAAGAAHVEERSGPGCRPVHAPDCARCQSLSTHAATAPAPAVDWTRAAAHVTPPSDDAAWRGVSRPALPLSRAPPLHS